MNRNEKEKPARIEIRVRPKVKEKIQKLADRCGLSVSEYMVKRALGYEPRAVQPETFFSCYKVLCQLVNQKPSPEAEEKLLDVIDRMQLALLPGKKDFPGTPQSLLCGEKEHPRSCEPVGADTDSEGRSVM